MTYYVYTSSDLDKSVARLEDRVDDNRKDGTKHPCDSNSYPSCVAFLRIHSLGEEQREWDEEYKHEELAFQFVNCLGNPR